MISVTEAKSIIKTNVPLLTPKMVAIQDAAGLVLAEDVFASIDIPAFNQSAMDGYAFAYESLAEGKALNIIGEVQAGVDKTFESLQNAAVRIFTGAPVPAGADTVVMQEKTTLTNGELTILDDQLARGNNVRLKGAEIRKGELALQAGTLLAPAALGFLAGLGVAEVMVYPTPRVTIIVTGKELQQPGKQLQPGQVYESNSLTVKAALKQLNISDVQIVHVDDDLQTLTNTLANALERSDMVLLTGGISVGDYDFVLQATELCGVIKLFHKIKQRPGKPLFFGKKGEKIVFGLPGNPSSVLTCFFEYVIPAIETLTLRKKFIKVAELPLAKSYSKKTSLTHFLKGLSDGKTVTPLGAQDSFRLSSFALSNCLIVLPAEKEDFEEGELVEVHLLPM